MKIVSSYFCVDPSAINTELDDTFTPHDVHCPLIMTKKEDKENKSLNWCKAWCYKRILLNKFCSRNCPVADDIRQNRLQSDE